MKNFNVIAVMILLMRDKEFQCDRGNDITARMSNDHEDF